MMIKPQRVGENTLSRRGTRGSQTRGSSAHKSPHQKRVGGSMTSFCPHTFLLQFIYLDDGLSKYKFLILHSGILIFKWDAANLVSPRAYHFHAPLYYYIPPLSLFIIGLYIRFGLGSFSHRSHPKSRPIGPGREQISCLLICIFLFFQKWIRPLPTLIVTWSALFVKVTWSTQQQSPNVFIHVSFLKFNLNISSFQFNLIKLVCRSCLVPHVAEFHQCPSCSAQLSSTKPFSQLR